MSSQSDTKQGVQAFGRALSAMVMPNIGAFIAWGFITALFIDTGWRPNATLNELVGPMITYLLPLLIGYTGGKNVHDVRGGVIGAVATMGVIVGADVTMFIGAMIMGPLAAVLIKQFDKAVDGKIPAGFEMLVNNFSLGILGAVLAIAGNLVIGPVVQLFTGFLSSGVSAIVNMGILPLISVFVEPAKVLFLNNALNHGIFGPLGVEQIQEAGKSIFFLVESNPGPGLGILLAYWVFAKGTIKQSAPGAVIIHFLGGIHEIYFPYILMNPALILAVIAGGASGVLTFSILGAGLVATPSPGSIFAIMALAPRGGLIPVLAGVVVATAVSFVVASFFVKRAAAKMTDEDLEQSKDKVSTMKVASKGQSLPATITKIIYACDAGMGSSAMGATMLAKKLKEEGIDIFVKNYAINDIPSDASIVISHEQLTGRAKKQAPGAYHISVTDFLDMSVAEHVKELINKTGTAQSTTVKETKTETSVANVLNKNSIVTGQKADTKEDAIRLAGKILVEQGYAEEAYVESMIKREADVTTYIGRGVAIPHGLGEDKKAIKKSGVSIVQFPEGVSFGDEKAYLVIGIAGKDNEHLGIIAKLAEVISSMEEKDLIQTIQKADLETLYKMFDV